MTTELEKAIALKYKRMTGVEPIGLVDTLRILASDDLFELTQEYLDSKGSA